MPTGPGEKLAGEADVVVVGGGVVGALIALESERRGLRVILLETQPQLFNGTTQAAFGSLTPFSDPFFAGASRNLAVRGLRLYREHVFPLLDMDGDRPVDYCDKGLIDILDTQEDIANARALVDDLEASGYLGESRLITRSEALELEPNLPKNFGWALFLNEPWVDTHKFLQIVRDKLQQAKGVSVRESTEALKLEPLRRGWAIHTAGSSTLGAENVVLCTGIGNGFPRGVRRPCLYPVRGDAVEVIDPSGGSLFERHIYRRPGFITPRSGGRLWIGATYEEEDLADGELPDRDRISVRQLLALVAGGQRILPRLTHMEIVRTWRGWRASSRDGLPIVGPGPRRGLIYAVGLKGLGITMAPAIAECVARGFESSDWSGLPREFDPCRTGALEGSPLS